MWWESPTRPLGAVYWLRCWETLWVRAPLNPPQSNISVSCINTDPLHLSEQTRRWRFGWTSTAGRKTRRGRSSSSTRKRASSPRTSWRKSTLRVSARPTKADVQTSEVLGSFCCLSFHRCIQHHGYISVTHTHANTHTPVMTESTRLFFINIFFAIKVIYHLPPRCVWFFKLFSFLVSTSGNYLTS